LPDAVSKAVFPFKSIIFNPYIVAPICHGTNSKSPKP